MENSFPIRNSDSRLSTSNAGAAMEIPLPVIQFLKMLCTEPGDHIVVAKIAKEADKVIDLVLASQGRTRPLEGEHPWSRLLNSLALAQGEVLVAAYWRHKAKAILDSVKPSQKPAVRMIGTHNFDQIALQAIANKSAANAAPSGSPMTLADHMMGVLDRLANGESFNRVVEETGITQMVSEARAHEAGIRDSLRALPGAPKDFSIVTPDKPYRWERRESHVLEIWKGHRGIIEVRTHVIGSDAGTEDEATRIVNTLNAVAAAQLDPSMAGVVAALTGQANAANVGRRTLEWHQEKERGYAESATRLPEEAVSANKRPRPR